MKRIISAVLLVAVLVLSLSACTINLGGQDKLEAINLSETSVELSVGETKTLTVTAQPEGVSIGEVIWSSSDNYVATVNTGTIKAVAAGNATITATTADGVTASCTVTVKEVEITDITLNKSTAGLKVGSTIQLEAFVTPNDAPKGKIKWTSSDSSVATVNSEGYITGVKAGVVNITCTAGEVEASCTVTVKGDEPVTAPDANASNNSSSNGSTVNNYYGTHNPGYSSGSGDFVFADSSSRKLSRSEINSRLSSMSGYSPSGNYAQDAINEIYARNGYVFKSANLRSYYEGKSWYYPNSSFNASYFNSVENYNIKLLGEYT